MNKRQAYRMYLNDSPIGISLYACSLDCTDDDMFFFNDANNMTICCISVERIARIQVFDYDVMRDVTVFESETVTA